MTSTTGSVVSEDPEADPDIAAFVASVDRVLQRSEVARLPVGRPGTDHSGALAHELAGLGWSEVWRTAEMRPFLAPVGTVLGRHLAPLSLVDLPCLGGALALDGVVRYADAAPLVMLPDAGAALRCAAVPADRRKVALLDPLGAARCELPPGDVVQDGPRRVDAWMLATLGYQAGMAGTLLDWMVDHARRRTAFGAPLASQPVVQQRLADAAVAREQLRLLATAAGERAGLPSSALVFAGRAVTDFAASAHQIAGAIGFAMESVLPHLSRRARSMAVWNDRALLAWGAVG